MTSDLFSRTRRPLNLAVQQPEIFELLPGTGQTLAFQMQTQEQSQWCWSAVAVSVSKFYEASSTITQCALASLELGTHVCCGNPSACNVDHTLETALEQVHHFNDLVHEPLSFERTVAEITHGRPLGCRIGWFAGDGHFLIIHGTSIETSGGGQRMWVAVADPRFGPADYLIDDFTNAYRQGEGEWTHSYLTR
jgi:hypothetical protein